jgi:glycosyltransferase involved in cell wall biosynthesis
MKISTTIITFNEESHIRRCMKSVQGLADEIIIVDSESQDKTREIAEAYGAKVFSRRWTNYADQKNFASAQASYSWILSLDADECLSAALHQQIAELKSSEKLVEAYEFPRLTFYLGRWIRHSGWYPDYKVRLYRKEEARWEGQFVHEALRVNGRITRIEADLLHYTCDSVAAHARRLEKYTSLAAQDLWNQGKRAHLSNLLGSPFVAFLKCYFLKAGFRDGIQGCLIAAFAAYYNFLKYAKLWESEHRPNETQDYANQSSLTPD